nr:MAG TPA: hypothetical protein [Bacteriophage sp.]
MYSEPLKILFNNSFITYYYNNYFKIKPFKENVPILF